MGESVWSSLPEDLQLRILAHLPLESLARREHVCRDWKSLWQNRGFLHLRSQLETETASSNSWFIFQGKFRPGVRVDCYNTHSNKWHKLRFDDLPPVQEVCAASGGLLLCAGKMQAVGQGFNFFDLIVCNPLKLNSCELIPRSRGSGFIRHVGMVGDTRTGNYKVMLTSLKNTKIYDSRQKNWKSFDSILSPPYDLVHSSPLEYRGRLLYLGMAANRHGKVFAYNLEDNICTSFDSYFSPNSFHDLEYLESCAGRLFMMTLYVHHSHSNSNLEVRVREYVHTADYLSDGVWRELTSIPTLELERSMSVNSNEGANFLAGAVASSSSSAGASSSSSRNDLLCFTMGIQDGRLTLFSDSKEQAVFLYSLSQNLWCFVRKRPEWFRGTIPTRSVRFNPSLHAPFVQRK